jgi:carbonic anhydrase
MSFFTAVNCMDGRVQLPVITFIRDRFNVRYVDTVTSAGPLRVLSDPGETRVTAAILRRITVSVEKHGSRGIAVVGHHDCAGNPRDEAAQREQIHTAVDFLAEKFPGIVVVGLWVNSSWFASEVYSRRPKPGTGS